MRVAVLIALRHPETPALSRCAVGALSAGVVEAGDHFHLDYWGVFPGEEFHGPVYSSA